MEPPLVSIIIPVYNAEKHLAETLNSALNQTWPNKEVIVVDDGSTDQSVAIAKSFGADRVKVYEQSNKRSGAARNKGLAEAQGDYIQFLDADDLLSPDKIERQIKLLLQHPGKIAVCSTVHFDNDKNPFDSVPTPYEDAFLYDTDSPAEFLATLYGGKNGMGSMIQTNAWLTPAGIIKKAGYWSEFYSPDDDGEYFCRVVLASSGIVYVKDCFNYYRKYKSDNNLAAIKTKQALQGKFKSFLLKKQHLLEATKDEIAKKALAHSAMDIAVDAWLVDKDLTREILKTIEDIGGTSYVPVLGGKGIEFIKRAFGWKTALKIRCYYTKYFK